MAAGRTIARKSPQQLAEVARAAYLLDGVKHMVMTTGTPSSEDRGARILSDCAQSIRAAVDLPLQAQCEPPSDDLWHVRMKESGIDSLGMHLEVVNPILRKEIMPGKSEVSLDRYLKVFPLRSKFSDGDRFRLTFSQVWETPWRKFLKPARNLHLWECTPS